jgi:NitT/TauT family transport system permease protein
MNELRRFVPVLLVLLCVTVVWYVASVGMNWDLARSLADDDAGSWDVLAATQALDRPLVPAPHQVLVTLYADLVDWPVGSPRSLVFHAGVTAAAAGAGLLIAIGFGLLLAIGIVYVRVLDRALMPWVIASQTVPVLAIAPMVVVVLGNAGFTGLLPKALIAGWLSFFPITTGMVKGLRSPDPMQRDLMRTYHASVWQNFALLRWPASVAFLFPGLKLAVALALVGAIVSELPTGAQAGLGARLLAGSYYGQTLQIWAVLVLASLLALLATGAVDLGQALTARARGGRL